MRKHWMLVTGLLVIGALGIAVPAWAEDDGDPGGLEAAPVPAPPGAETIAVPGPQAREDFDAAFECMAGKGYGPPGEGEDNVVIPPSEIESAEFRAAAEECDLPPPPTDADIRALACDEDRARDEN
jgi:hypothetical protein